MKNIKVMALGLALILMLQTGCATVLVRSGSEKGLPLYPATSLDVVAVIIPFVDLDMSGSGSRHEQNPLVFLLIPGGLIDLPISIVTDTLFLPYDILILVLDD